MNHELITDDLTNDIIEAFREQVRQQAQRIKVLENFIRSLDETPHDWLKTEINAILGESD